MLLLEIAQVYSFESFLIQVERRKLLLTAMRWPFFFLLLELSSLIHLIVQLLLFRVIALSFPPFHAIFELSNII